MKEKISTLSQIPEPKMVSLEELSSKYFHLYYKWLESKYWLKIQLLEILNILVISSFILENGINCQRLKISFSECVHKILTHYFHDLLHLQYNLLFVVILFLTLIHILVIFSSKNIVEESLLYL